MKGLETVSCTAIHAVNLRRLMARQGLSVREVIKRSGLDARTVQGVLSGTKSRPQAQTLHQLATGLGVSADELFQPPAMLSLEQPPPELVAQLVSEHPDVFAVWSNESFHCLYRQIEASPAATREWLWEVVQAIDLKQRLFQKSMAILDSEYRDMFAAVVDVFYAKIEVK